MYVFKIRKTECTKVCIRLRCLHERYRKKKCFIYKVRRRGGSYEWMYVSINQTCRGMYVCVSVYMHRHENAHESACVYFQHVDTVIQRSRGD